MTGGVPCRKDRTRKMHPRTIEFGVNNKVVFTDRSHSTRLSSSRSGNSV
jgi:hypothetical protein